MAGKFHLRCKDCSYIVKDFKEWFSLNQKCPKCSGKWVLAEYQNDFSGLIPVINEANGKAKDLFHYFDYLPLNNTDNIVSEGEGIIPVERWEFLEKFAKESCNLDLEVMVYRNDMNPGTGTFKDIAAALVASVLKEAGVKEYVVASTGNIANAFAHYLALAGISLTVFIPQDALLSNEAGVGSYGQRVYRVKGDYHKAKKLASEYSQKYNVLISGGNIDPMRVEAKKTMVYEWLRLLNKLPDVYIQALSGGTGPIAIDKGIDELGNLNLINKRPRYILIQPDQCDPMTKAWDNAKAKGFPEGWQQEYPVMDNPVTKVPTLATGNPITFPIIADVVKNSGGEIISFTENEISDVARLVAYETSIKIGPAATIAVGGFFEALHKGHIKNGESVMINVGEGVRRAPELMNEMTYTTKLVDSLDECEPTDRAIFRDGLWIPFNKYSR
ncbi:MAG: hypothetical protein C0594_07755 [Marinilabiliales bacterium]|nr:MAG: hypothetical protein C0594_07755 [Marinilabiliales bacterium]